MQMLMHTGGIAQTNCYLLADEQTRQAVLIDAPDHTIAPLLDAAAREKWNIIALWLTHGHFDHVADHAVLTARFPAAKVLIHPLDEPKLQNPGASGFRLPFVIPSRSADAYFDDGQTLTLGTTEFHVIHTPGHAPGHVVFYSPAMELVLGGDLIMAGSVGRSDLPDSDPDALDASIRTVMGLPDLTRLLPGHGQPTTLGDERASNAFVRQAIAGR